MNAGSGIEGAQDGPAELIDAGCLNWLARHIVEYQAIDVDVLDPAERQPFEQLRCIADNCARLRHAVRRSLESGRLPVIIGGDHSLTWGSLAGVLDVYADARCLYIDAHGDINTFEGSPSGHIHGMHLSFLTGICQTDRLVPQYIYPTLRPADLKFIATRSLDVCEQQIAHKYNLDITTAADIRRLGIDHVAAGLRDWLADDNTRHVHMSFDIDAIDPLYAPSTGVPVRGGITPAEAICLMGEALRSGKIVAIDMVEFNPRLGDKQVTLGAWKQIFESVSLNL